MNQCFGIGTDIIEIARIQEAYERYGERFLERILTENEHRLLLQHAKFFPRLAGRFAAKEAIAKAFGTGISKEVGWHDLEVINEASGKPEVLLSQNLRSRFPGVSVLLSISHCQTHATATALILE